MKFVRLPVLVPSPDTDALEYPSIIETIADIRVDSISCLFESNFGKEGSIILLLSGKSLRIQLSVNDVRKALMEADCLFYSGFFSRQG